MTVIKYSQDGSGVSYWLESNPRKLVFIGDHEPLSPSQVEALKALFLIKGPFRFVKPGTKGV
jgi:hypothetical protein